MCIHQRVNAINLLATCTIVAAVTANAMFTKNDAVDVCGDYGDYEITTTTTRSIFECATICYGLDDCRAFLLNSITDFSAPIGVLCTPSGECIAYTQDISDTSGQAVFNTTIYSYFKDTVMDLVSGRGSYSWQETTYKPTEGHSHLALDGNTNPNWSGGSCMHTKGSYKPWWAVDLGSFVKIKRILLYQRTDCCVGEFVDVTFMVGDTVEAINTYQGTECTTYEGPATSTPFPLEIFCDKVVRGKYLKVYRTTALRKSLVFCEISVFSF